MTHNTFDKNLKTYITSGIFFCDTSGIDEHTIEEFFKMNFFTLRHLSNKEWYLPLFKVADTTLYYLDGNLQPRQCFPLSPEADNSPWIVIAS